MEKEKEQKWNMSHSFTQLSSDVLDEIQEGELVMLAP